MPIDKTAPTAAEIRRIDATVFRTEQARQVVDPPTPPPVSPALVAAANSNLDRFRRAAALFSEALIDCEADRCEALTIARSANPNAFRVSGMIEQEIFGPSGVLNAEAIDHGAARELLRRRAGEVNARVASRRRSAEGP
jgi:hypothetical protein